MPAEAARPQPRAPCPQASCHDRLGISVLCRRSRNASLYGATLQGFVRPAAERPGTPYLVLDTRYHRQRHYRLLRVRKRGEQTRNAHLDVIHRCAVRRRQPRSYIVEITLQHLVGIFVQRKGTRCDIDVNGLFHRRNYDIVRNLIDPKSPPNGANTLPKACRHHRGCRGGRPDPTYHAGCCVASARRSSFTLSDLCMACARCAGSMSRHIAESWAIDMPPVSSDTAMIMASDTSLMPSAAR